MKKLIAIMLLLGCGAAQAALVTIDFEEQPALAFPFAFESKGFDFVAGDFAFLIGENVETGNTDVTMVNDQINSMSLSSGTFSLLSLDAKDFCCPVPVDDLLVTGFFQGGGSISTLLVTAEDYNTFAFSNSWQGLISVHFESAGGYTVDNVVVNVIPIPAAVWLFGSGLGLLGWFRRNA